MNLIQMLDKIRKRCVEVEAEKKQLAQDKDVARLALYLASVDNSARKTIEANADVSEPHHYFTKRGFEMPVSIDIEVMALLRSAAVYHKEAHLSSVWKDFSDSWQREGIRVQLEEQNGELVICFIPARL